jgi:hypothetical protein
MMLRSLLFGIILLVAAIPSAADTMDPEMESAGLLESIRDARRNGDMVVAAGLEERLAELEGRESVTLPAALLPSYRLRGGPVGDGNDSGERWQGYDVPVAVTSNSEIQPDIASDLAGNLYMVVEHEGYYSTEEQRARIYRSTDGGESWALWFDLDIAADIASPTITAGLGAANMLLVAYQTNISPIYGHTEIGLISIDLDSPVSWTSQTLFTNALGVANPRIVTDCDEYSGWYAHVVFNVAAVDNWLLYYARSSTYGDSWTVPVTLASYCGYPEEYYHGYAAKPDIDHGSGNLYVAYDNYDNCVDPQRDIYLLRSMNDGASFDPAARLASSDDDEYWPAVVASRGSGSSGTVILAYTRNRALYYTVDVDYAYSTDSGDIWTTNEYLSSYSNVSESAPVLAASRNLGNIDAAWWLQGNIYHASVPFDQPTQLSFAGAAVNYPNHVSNMFGRPALCVNSTLPAADQAAIAWTDERDYLINYDYDVYFDGPLTEGLGSVMIDIEPDGLGGSWLLRQWYPYYENAGTEDALLTDMDEGDYEFTVYPPENWIMPGENPATGILLEGQTLVFQAELDFVPPLLTGLTDIGNDQGGQLRLSWERSAHDAPDTGVDVTGYSIYRRQDGDRNSAAGAPAIGERVDGWDWLIWLPAYGDDIYQSVVPTLCDSTLDGGICWSAFFVRASTADPFTYFDSAPDSAYSVDNLAPAPPSNLRLPAAATLAWDGVPDEDFDYYSIVASASEDLSGAVLLGHTSGSEFDVTGSGGLYLGVAATDFAGNQGEFSTILYDGTDAPEGQLPTRYELEPNRPNPFNPSTEIRFALPEPALLNLKIYDLSGRLIRTLLDQESRNVGRHAELWDGRNDAGKSVSSGIYFARMEASTFVQMRKMTLLK